MKKYRIGVVAISDERPQIHEPDKKHNISYLRKQAGYSFF